MTEHIPIDMDVALDPEKYTVSITLRDIPLKYLEGVLINISRSEWRRNVIDGVHGAVAAKDLGVCSTERKFFIE